jgi:phenylalanine-4-hydroxylase
LCLTAAFQERLEQLDQTMAAQEKVMQQMSQQEYIKNIEDLHADLSRAWEHQERVKALKICIQVLILVVYCYCFCHHFLDLLRKSHASPSLTSLSAPKS